RDLTGARVVGDEGARRGRGLPGEVHAAGDVHQLFEAVGDGGPLVPVVDAGALDSGERGVGEEAEAVLVEGGVLGVLDESLHDERLVDVDELDRVVGVELGCALVVDDRSGGRGEAGDDLPRLPVRGDGDRYLRAGPRVERGLVVDVDPV